MRDEVAVSCIRRDGMQRDAVGSDSRARMIDWTERAGRSGRRCDAGDLKYTSVSRAHLRRKKLV